MTTLRGAAPFGFRWDEDRLVPDPHEAPVRRLVHELFLEHRRKKTVARILNDKGYRTRRGAKFSDTTIARLLRDPAAKGQIVSDELWERCNAIFDRAQRSEAPLARRPVQVFAGLTYCACGHRMYVPSNTPKYVCRRCRNKVPAADLEAVFREQLKTVEMSHSEVAAHRYDSDDAIREWMARLRTLEREQTRVRGEMEKAYRLHANGRMSEKTFERRHRPLEGRLAELEREIPRVQAALDFLKIDHLSAEGAGREVKDFYARWPELSGPEKRKVVESTVERITVGKGEVAIDLWHAMPSENVVRGQQTGNLTLPSCHGEADGRASEGGG